MIEKVKQLITLKALSTLLHNGQLNIHQQLSFVGFQSQHFSGDCSVICQTGYGCVYTAHIMNNRVLKDSFVSVSTHKTDLNCNLSLIHI